MASLPEIAATLKARRSGSGWIARCPAHNDRSPSLRITERNGRILVHCHAGCSQDDVIDALRGRGLWPERSRTESRHPAPDPDWPADLERAVYWALAVEQFAEQALEELEPWSLERYGLTQLLRTIRLGDASMVAEFRRRRARDPKMAAGLVHAGRLHDARVQRDLALRLRRHLDGA